MVITEAQAKFKIKSENQNALPISRDSELKNYEALILKGITVSSMLVSVKYKL